MSAGTSNEALPPRQIQVTIHEEGGTYWAESEQMQNWTGAADTFEEMVKLSWEAVRLFGESPATVVILFPAQSGVSTE